MTHIDGTGFGWIEIDTRRYAHDVIIYGDGRIENRYQDFQGDSHIFSLMEARKVVATPAQNLVVGTGQAGVLRVPSETRKFLDEQEIVLHVQRTPQAIQTFNRLTGTRCALFHVTC